MKIGIISGSHRPSAESLRVARYIQETISQSIPNCETHLFNLADNPLPLWDDTVWDNHPKWKTIWEPFSQALRSCDGFIVIAPEWSGMVPAGLKNFFLFCTHQDIGHKAALIVSVSSSRGGAYPVHELRISSYKNTRLCYIPEHVIIRDVNNMLHGAEPKSEDDRYIRGRLAYALRLLGEYTKALNAVRASDVIDHKTYPNGM